MVVEIQLPVQSVPITTNVSLNTIHGEVYLMEHYVIKFVIDLQWFSPDAPFSSTNKTDRHNIAEILLKPNHKCILIAISCNFIHFLF